MIRTYQFKLFKTKKQKHLKHIVDVCTEIYNHTIAFHKTYYRLYKKHANTYQIQAHYAKLKKLPKYAHWNDVPSQSIQEITTRIQKSYKAFFKYIQTKIGPKRRPPKFKKRSKYKSFTLKQAGWKILGDTIWLNGYKYRFNLSRPIIGKIQTITVKRDGLGDFYIYIAAEGDFESHEPMTGKIAGFDFSFQKFLVPDSTNGDLKVQNPLFYLKLLPEFRKAHKEFSRKEKGSKNRYKAFLNLMRIYKRLTNKRKDYQFKLVKALLDEFDVLCFEDLNIAGMKRLWGRKVSDLSFSTFLRILDGKAQERGKLILKVDRFFPSSKRCSKCKFVLPTLDLKTRAWTCPECGVHHDRDINAADNILEESQRIFSAWSVDNNREEDLYPVGSVLRGGTSSLRLEDVRPA